MKKKGNKKNLPFIKKNITAFLSSEEGKISKEKIVKIGLGLAALSVLLDASSSAAAVHNSWHLKTNVIGNVPEQGYHNSHHSHGSHASHGSHGSHASHGSHNIW